MTPHFFRHFLVIVLGAFLAANAVSAAETNTNTTVTVTRDEMAQNYLHLQEQIQSTRLAVKQSQMEMSYAARTNANALVARMQSLDKSFAAQRATDTATAHKTQQLMIFMAGAFGLAVLGIMLLMIYFQWRAFSQLAQISAHQQAVIADVGGNVRQMAAPGRAQVETSNARLLNVVGQLERRIQELEGGQAFLPGSLAPKPVDLLTEAQKHLDANQPQLALNFLEKFLTDDPANANALIKKAIALEKLGRLDEALTFCDQAIALDGTLALAHLHKGGVLNRLRRYDEALDCYESALQAQEKRTTSLTR